MNLWMFLFVPPSLLTLNVYSANKLQAQGAEGVSKSLPALAALTYLDLE